MRQEAWSFHKDSCEHIRINDRSHGALLQAEAGDQRVNDLLKTPLKEQGRPGPAGTSMEESQGPPAGSHVQGRPQAHRGSLTSLSSCSSVFPQPFLTRWPGCGLPAPSLLVEAGGPRELLETCDVGNPQPRQSASSSRPSLPLTCCLSFPAVPQACPICLLHEAFTGPRLCPGYSTAIC